jgi:hypothetical protein
VDPTTIPGRLASLDQPLRHEAPELRSRAEDLLSRPPYVAEEPGLMERALTWLGDLIAQVLRIITDGIAATGTLGAWAIVAIGTAILAVVVWRLTRGAPLDRHAPVVPAGTRPRTAASWRAEAADHEAAGRGRDAVRCWYAALVVSLAEQGTIEDVPGRTVRELDAEVARVAPELHPEVTAAGDRFEAVVYGAQSATDEDLDVVKAAVNAIAGAPA